MTGDLGTELVALISEKFATDGAVIELDTDLLLGGMVDSLGVILVVKWLEDRLGIEIDASDVTLENFQTIAAMVRYAEQRQTATL